MTRSEFIKEYSDGRRDFRLANLRGVDLSGVDLSGVDLSRADLWLADLRRADLRRANLEGADLSRANLEGADLWLADLSRADLRRANLEGADLSRANLDGASLDGARLQGTCLDPTNTPNGDVGSFEIIRDRNNTVWRIGYRTISSPVLGNRDDTYIPGTYHEAPVFSTDSTSCHPGIYVCPTVAGVDYSGAKVRVLFRPEECHKAGDKWRVRWLIVDSVVYQGTLGGAL